MQKARFDVHDALKILQHQLREAHKKKAHKMQPPTQKRYVSPTRIFSKKANKTCETYRRAYGFNAKLNACLDCKREKCLVEIKP